MNCLRTIKDKNCKGEILKFSKTFYSFDTKEITHVPYYKCNACRRIPLEEQQIVLGLNKKGEKIQ